LEALRFVISPAVAFEYCRDSARLTHFTISPIPTHFNVLFRQHAELSSLRHSIALTISIGILTDLASAAAFACALAPD
jgi:hypothetical protein